MPKPEPPDYENIGSVPVEAIRDLLIMGEPFHQAIEKIKKNVQPKRTGIADPPVAWLYKRYKIGRPTCVKIGRMDAWDRVNPAIQLFFDRKWRLPNDVDAVEAITEAVLPLVVSSGPAVGKDNVADAITKALEPFTRGGKWSIEPFLLRPEFVQERERYVVQITDKWIELLLDCVEQVFTNLDTAKHLVNADTRGNNQAVGFQERLRCLQRFNPKEFFSVHATEQANNPIHKQWMIASLWDDWERALTEWDDRVCDLQRLDCNVELRWLQNFCKAKGLVRKSGRAGKGGRPSHASVRMRS